jgi:hypothetical protein
MNVAYFRFYEELNDFLPPERRKVSFPWPFQGSPPVKFGIEALGVPHTEVDMILVNSHSVDFSYKIGPDDQISVYPVFESLDIAPVSHLREKPLREPKFIADSHLGRLTKYLRLFGFDTHYRNSISDREIIDLAEAEKRVVLTRDRDLLKNRRVTRGYWVRSQQREEQLGEVLSRFDLRNRIRPFSRCMVCNGTIMEVAREKIVEKLLPKTRLYFQEFWRCEPCGRIYWKGSHWERMKEFVSETRIVKSEK